MIQQAKRKKKSREKKRTLEWDRKIVKVKGVIRIKDNKRNEYIEKKISVTNRSISLNNNKKFEIE